MLRLVMENAGLALWPALSLLIFFGSTLGVLLWIYRPGSSDFYRHLGTLALQESGETQKTDAAAGNDIRSAASSTPKISSEN